MTRRAVNEAQRAFEWHTCDAKVAGVPITLDTSRVVVLPPKKAKKEKPPPLCRCGHEMDRHVKKLGPRKRGCETCNCARYVVRGRPKIEAPDHLRAPAGSFELWRPDTKRKKKMGWAVIAPRSIRAFLELRVKSANELLRYLHGAKTKEDIKRIQAGAANERKRYAECAIRAVETCIARTLVTFAKDGVMAQRSLLDLGRPSRVVVARYASGRGLDDDNLISGMKPIRDGVAEALLFDDSEFSARGEDGKVPIVYENRASQKRKFFAVMIEVEW